MKGNFVSDISGILLDYYDNQEFEKIQNAIENEITNLTGSYNYESAYRLQQDIAFLNTELLTNISKYINTNAPNTKEENENNTQKDTFKAQSNASKINLSYKYFYLLIKLIVIILLLGAIYFYFFKSSSKGNKTTSFNQEIGFD